jgi:hypothetical protein
MEELAGTESVARAAVGLNGSPREFCRQLGDALDAHQQPSALVGAGEWSQFTLERRSWRLTSDQVRPPAQPFADRAVIERPHPDRRDQVAADKVGEHARVDAVGLADKRGRSP